MANYENTFAGVPLEVSSDAPIDRIVVHPALMEHLRLAFLGLSVKTVHTAAPLVSAAAQAEIK